jgi:hypothetical protein
MQNYILDASMSGGITAAAQITTGQDPNMLPIIVGILAPVIKEALFRLIDKIGTLHKERKERRAKK